MMNTSAVRSLIRRVWAVAIGLLVAIGLAACGDSGDEGLLGQARADGVLAIGLANEEPYGYVNDDGEATGAAPEVAREVLERLGIPEIDAVVVDFGSLISGLNAGAFDMIAAGMFITPVRAQVFLFSDPDYCTTEAFLVAAGNPHDITDFASIAANEDVVLGILEGTAEQAYAEDAGIPAERIEVFTSGSALVDALIAGSIDAVALTTITANTIIQQLDNPDIEATEGFVPVDAEGNEQLACGGYGFRYENQDFRDAFNDVLVDMKQDDEILPIVEEFGFPAADVDAAKGVTAEDLTESGS